MHFKVILLLLPAFLIASCSHKYQSYTHQYQFTSQQGVPDYASLDYWAAHPWKWDPSDSVPAPLADQKRDSTVDVFFLHPTTFTSKKTAEIPNASIDDQYINAKTDYSTILYQASVFNRDCRVFAPRYRQAHISNFLTEDKAAAANAFDLAYADVKTAFIYYLQHWNNGKPIIIASHSQGSLLAERLLKEFFEDQDLKKQLVVAYVLGWGVPKDYFSGISMCEDSLATGCICSWRTLRNGYVPPFLKNENGNSYATNPLTWTTGNEYAAKGLNKGSVLTKFNKVYKHSTDAALRNGLLYVHKPRFPWGFLYSTKNYHIADINLFYLNIQENIQQRIRSYNKN